MGVDELMMLAMWRATLNRHRKRWVPLTVTRQGIHDMLEHGGSKILPVIPQLIIPIKSAFAAAWVGMSGLI
jgi:hypothetical protein